MTTVKAEVAEKVKAAVTKVLAEQYGAETVFDPIVVVPRDDGDGEMYLHVYMVLDENTTKDLTLAQTHSVPEDCWRRNSGEGYHSPEVLTQIITLTQSPNGLNFPGAPYVVHQLT